MFQRINLLLLFLTPYLFFAQDFKKELKSIVDKLDSASVVSLTVKINAYQKKGGSLIYNTTSLMNRKYKNTYTKLGEMEYISCDGYQLQIDNSEKYIYVSKKKKTNQQDLQIDIKSLKKFYEQDEKSTQKAKIKSELIGESGGIKSYKITGSDDASEIIFDLDVKNGKLKRVIYTYSQESSVSAKYIVLDYTQFEIGQSDFDFDLKRYFTLSNDKYILSSKYKTYKLIVE